jgi:uncharacterized repeat protein (TIGR01451 family)
VTAPADLSVTLTDSPDPVTRGSNLTYTLVVRNAGPNPAATVKLIDTLPAGVTFVSASTGCRLASGKVTCNLGTLANGASMTKTVVVRPTTVGTRTNRAQMTSATGDPNASNNTRSVTTTVR